MKTVKILNLVQGTDEWLEARKEYLTASEASAMMGESKYKSRGELLKEKKTGKAKPVNSFTQSLFDKGHQAEDDAREILELELMEEFKPIVGSIEIEELKLLASLDGLSEDGNTIFEHKLWNETLAENVNNSVLEPSHYWQLEFQLMVFGSESVLFMTSDGTNEKKADFSYFSIPERREKLIKGLKQFAEDLKNYEVKAKQEVIVANEQESFPIIKCSVEGSLVISNLGEYIPVIKKLADEQMSIILETDQDFADKEAFNKNVKAGRATLKTQAADIEKQFKSLAEFNGFVGQADKILQKLQSHGEGQVKEAKVTKKLSIINNAVMAFNSHLSKLSENINGVKITEVVVDFESVMKGKRSFEKMEEAVNSELANAKIEANEISQVIRKNLDSFTELATKHKFLFSDHALLLLKDNDDLVNLIKARISEHEEAETKRKAEEKKLIEAKAKEEAELKAQAELKQKEEAIRKEERTKVEAEQQQVADHSEAIKINTRNEQPVTEILEENYEKPVKQRLTEIFEQESPHCEGLAHEAYEAHKKAEQKWHAYANELPLGDKRVIAFQIYENIRVATRVS